MIDPFHMTAHVLEDTAHQIHIEDRGHIAEAVATRCQQCRHHFLEDGVLGPENTDRPLQPRSSLDDELGHPGECSEAPAQRRVSTGASNCVSSGCTATLPAR